MLLAELTSMEMAGLICSMVFGAIGVVIGGVSLFKKQDAVISPQPLTVEIVKALHDQFAAKSDFDRLTEINSERHADLYSRIEAARKDARDELVQHMEQISMERQRTAERLNEQFTFIRESLSAINREMSIRRPGAGSSYSPPADR